MGAFLRRLWDAGLRLGAGCARVLGFAPGPGALPPATERQITLARLGLYWERLWPGLATAAAPLLLFVGLALLGAFDRWDGFVHAAAFAVTVAASLVLAYAAIRGARWPGREEAMARIEKANGARHQPLRGLADRPSAPETPGTLGPALWQAHRARLAKNLGRLRAPWPRAQLPARDPFALRFLALLLVLLGAFAAGADWKPRLARAFAPSFETGGTRAPAILEAWIQPPAYTGLAPLHLLSGEAPAAAAERVRKSVPQGSELVIRATRTRHGVRLTAQTHGEDETPPVPVGFETTADGRLEARLRLDETTSVLLGPQRRPHGDWMIRVREDAPPMAEFTGPLAVTPHGSIALPIAVEDDYGIDRAELTIEPKGASAEERIIVPVAVPRGPSRFEDRVLRDLTGHPGAGRPAKAWLTVWDAPGQRAKSAEIVFTLPEREFVSPLARALVEQRRHLLDDPGSAPRVASVLDALAAGEERYWPNARHYLTLRGAYWRLQHGHAPEAAEDAAAILWALALALDDRGLTTARQALQERIEALKDALARGADDAEIAERMADVRAALERYLAALAEAGQNAPEGTGSGQSVEAGDIRDYLDRLAGALDTGSTEDAQRMLSDLGAVIDSLRPQGAPSEGPDGSPMGEALAGLSNLIAKQRDLIDETHRARLDGSRAHETEALADAQRDLAEDTSRLGRTLEEADIKTPLALDLARHAMGSAGKALERRRSGRAMEAQGRAVEALKEAADEIIRSLTGEEGQGEGAQQAGPGAPGGQGFGQGQAAGRLDPLGRQMGGQGPALGAAVELPSEAAVQRARRILDELRRRAGERARPQTERDYIERLLKRF